MSKDILGVASRIMSVSGWNIAYIVNLLHQTRSEVSSGAYMQLSVLSENALNQQWNNAEAVLNTVCHFPLIFTLKFHT